MKKKEKKAKKKQRGRSKIGNKMSATTRQTHEKERAKNKLAYLKDYEREQRERATIEQDLAFLGKHEGKFDPVDQLFDKDGNKK